MKKALSLLLVITTLLSLLPPSEAAADVTVPVPDSTSAPLGQLPYSWIREDYRGGTYSTGSDASFNYFSVADGGPYGYPAGTKVLLANTKDKKNPGANLYSINNINKITTGHYGYKDYTVDGTFSIQEKTANIIVRNSRDGRFYMVQFSAAANKVILYEASKVGLRKELKSVPITRYGMAYNLLKNTVYSYKVAVSTTPEGAASIKVYLYSSVYELLLDYTDTTPIPSGKFGYWLNYNDKACYVTFPVTLAASEDYSAIQFKTGSMPIRQGERLQLRVEGILNGKAEDITDAVRYETNNDNITVTPTGLVIANNDIAAFPASTRVEAIYENATDPSKTRKAVIYISIRQNPAYSDIYRARIGSINVSGAGKGQIYMSIKGSTVINILGNSGDCEDLSSRSATNGIQTPSINKVFGSRAYQLTASSSNTEHYSDMLISKRPKVSADKYYCISAYIRCNVGRAYIKPFIWNVGNTQTTGFAAAGSSSTSFTRVWTKISTVGMTEAVADSLNVRFGLQDANGNTSFAGAGESAVFDGVMVNEISLNEYNDAGYTPPGYLNGDVSTNGITIQGSGEALNFDAELKSLQNGTADEINLNAGIMRQNISEWVMLDGDKSWMFHADFTGYKRISVKMHNGLDHINNSELVIKHDGSILRKADKYDWNGADIGQICDGYFFMTVSDKETGWLDDYTPSQAEIKAYMNGWRMCAADGSVYAGGTKYWKKISDGTGITAVCPTASYEGYTLGKLAYQLKQPIITEIGVKNIGVPQSGIITVQPRNPGKSFAYPMVVYSYPVKTPLYFDNITDIGSIFALKNYDTRVNYSAQLTAEGSEKVLRISTNSSHKREAIYYIGNGSSTPLTDGHTTSAVLKFEPGDTACLVANYDPVLGSMYKFMVNEKGISVNKVVKGIIAESQTFKYPIKPKTYNEITLKTDRYAVNGITVSVNKKQIGTYYDNKAFSKSANYLKGSLKTGFEAVLQTDNLPQGDYYYTFDSIGSSGTVIVEMSSDGVEWEEVSSITLNARGRYSELIQSGGNDRYRVKVSAEARIRNVGICAPLRQGFAGVSTTNYRNNTVYIKSFMAVQE